MLTRLYHYTIAFANKPTAIIALAIIAFVESSVFPIPPHALLIPLIIAVPHRAFLFAGITTIASVLGGALGYYIGAELFGAIGQPILDFYGKNRRLRRIPNRIPKTRALGGFIRGYHAVSLQSHHYHFGRGGVAIRRVYDMVAHRAGAYFLCHSITFACFRRNHPRFH